MANPNTVVVRNLYSMVRHNCLQVGQIWELLIPFSDNNHSDGYRGNAVIISVDSDWVEIKEVANVNGSYFPWKDRCFTMPTEWFLQEIQGYISDSSCGK